MPADRSAYPLGRERNLILAGLLILAAVAWGVLIWQADEMEGDHASMAVPEMAALVAEADADRSMKPIGGRRCRRRVHRRLHGRRCRRPREGHGR